MEPTQPPAPAHHARRTGRLVVLISGTGSNLAALLAAQQDPAYPARVAGVVSDRADAGGLEHARRAGVPTAVVAPADFADRAAWDRGMAEAIAVFTPDLVVSAGFMRILGAPVLERWPDRVVNTHPALLPSFPGAHAVRDALAYGAKVTGSTLHVVDAGTDTGPVIAQVAVPVEPGEDEAALHERIKVAERAMLVEWVGRIAAGGLSVDGRVVTVG
ncbi:phosphoribosylglycinamide formyltransferase [Cellulomonas denverensis]|uniref:Phosphoribosylglycinamide formyltransferase n=1 Tax=Cellulomonas denverensis TaxID=264297 RepID=A0A7X6KYH3_9CELL|nr:phosphoribosylglycinamide formyltransferase [Cellulomonas denverensis]NKY24528.1 phosphoribosylglycinamide formyltransferase [Cellulomonas denverensis]GIG26276.1 phosphoribosylglycinamide formyltransferase [Cellulomonas denverensis]